MKVFVKQITKGPFPEVRTANYIKTSFMLMGYYTYL